MRWRKARKYKVKQGSTLYDMYTKAYADEHNIPYLVNWRGMKDIAGNYILTDNLFVVRVLWDQKSCLKFPGFTFSKHNVYCVFPGKYRPEYDRMSVNRKYDGMTVFDQGEFCRLGGMTRDGKIRWPIEYMFITAYRHHFDLDKAVKEIWPNESNHVRRGIKNLLVKDEYILGLLMKDLRALFERANVDGVLAVRRMEKVSEDVAGKLNELSAPGAKVSVADYLQLASAAYKVNKNIAQITTEEGEVDEISGTLPTPLPELPKPVMEINNDGI